MGNTPTTKGPQKPAVKGLVTRRRPRSASKTSSAQPSSNAKKHEKQEKTRGPVAEQSAKQRPPLSLPEKDKGSGGFWNDVKDELVATGKKMLSDTQLAFTNPKELFSEAFKDPAKRARQMFSGIPFLDVAGKAIRGKPIDSKDWAHQLVNGLFWAPAVLLGAKALFRGKPNLEPSPIDDDAISPPDTKKRFSPFKPDVPENKDTPTESSGRSGSSQLVQQLQTRPETPGGSMAASQSQTVIDPSLVLFPRRIQQPSSHAISTSVPNSGLFDALINDPKRLGTSVHIAAQGPSSMGVWVPNTDAEQMPGRFRRKPRWQRSLDDAASNA